jgi:hypothetical protein
MFSDDMQECWNKFAKCDKGTIDCDSILIATIRSRSQSQLMNSQSDSLQQTSEKSCVIGRNF